LRRFPALPSRRSCELYRGNRCLLRYKDEGSPRTGFQSLQKGVLSVYSSLLVQPYDHEPFRAPGANLTEFYGGACVVLSQPIDLQDRKSTRLNSSHVKI